MTSKPNHGNHIANGNPRFEGVQETFHAEHDDNERGEQTNDAQRDQRDAAQHIPDDGQTVEYRFRTEKESQYGTNP